MAICVCGSFMGVIGDEFVCADCGRRKPIIIKVPSQVELWKEVQELRLIKAKYYKLIGEE